MAAVDEMNKAFAYVDVFMVDADLKNLDQWSSAANNFSSSSGRDTKNLAKSKVRSGRDTKKLANRKAQSGNEVFGQTRNLSASNNGTYPNNGTYANDDKYAAKEDENSTLILWNFKTPYGEGGRLVGEKGELMYGSLQQSDRLQPNDYFRDPVSWGNTRGIASNSNGNYRGTGTNSLCDKLDIIPQIASDRLVAFIRNQYGFRDSVSALFSLGVCAWVFISQLKILNPNESYLRQDFKGLVTKMREHGYDRLLWEALSLLSDLYIGEFEETLYELQSILSRPKADNHNQTQGHNSAQKAKLLELMRVSVEGYRRYFITLVASIYKLGVTEGIHDEGVTSLVTGFRNFLNQDSLVTELKHELRDAISAASKQVAKNAYEDLKDFWDKYQKLFIVPKREAEFWEVVGINVFYAELVSSFVDDVKRCMQALERALVSLVGIDAPLEREALLLALSKELSALFSTTELIAKDDEENGARGFLWRLVHIMMLKIINKNFNQTPKTLSELCPSGYAALCEIWQRNSMPESEKTVWRQLFSFDVDEKSVPIWMSGDEQDVYIAETFVKDLGFRTHLAKCFEVKTPFLQGDAWTNDAIEVLIESVDRDTFIVTFGAEIKDTQKLISAFIFAFKDQRLKIFRATGLFLSLDASFLKLFELAGAGNLCKVFNLVLLMLGVDNFDPAFVFEKTKHSDDSSTKWRSK